MTSSPDLTAVSRRLYEETKFWWGASLWIKIVVFAIGTLAVFGVDPLVVAAVAAFAYVVSEFCQWWSDRFKSAAENLRRKMDYFDSFGWALSALVQRDYLSIVPRRAARRLSDENKNEKYFASMAGPGVATALANLQESAWWTRQLSQIMVRVCVASIVALLIVALAILIVGLSVQTTALRAAIGRIVVAGISLVFSTGLFRLASGYHAAATAADRVIQRVEHIPEKREVDELTALKLWHDYHLARAGSPLLPSWLWRLTGSRFNSLWQEYQSSAD